MASFGAILLSSIIGELMGNASTMALEKDWVVVLAGGDSNLLSSMNATMRRIDLLCKLLAPLAFGVILQMMGDDDSHRLKLGAFIVAAWNLLSLPIEYHTVKLVYDSHKSALSHKVPPNTTAETPLEQLLVGWSRYVSHPVFWASFSYCMIYMTVLDNGVLMTAYLKWSGIPDGVLGASRGAGALLGIVGTFVFPCLVRCSSSVANTGAASIWLFWLFILPAGVSFAIDAFNGVDSTIGGLRVSPYLMLATVALSRVWLWCFDLAECQIMQEMVDENERGTMNAVQTAMYQVH
jgi:iron-regulated transporter 1